MRIRNCVVGIVWAAASAPVLATGMTGTAAAHEAQNAQRTCRGEPATLVGSDQLTGTRGRDVIMATTPSTLVHAGAGDDRLYGRGRSDDLSGDSGHDEVWGGPAWDVCARGNEIEHSCEADDWV